MTPEEKKALYRELLRAMTFTSDEMEGIQTVNIEDIDICSNDYMDTEIPDMTIQQIIDLFHFNDPNITKNPTIGRGDRKDEDGNPDNSQFSLVDNNPAPDSGTKIPGTDTNGLGMFGDVPKATDDIPKKDGGEGHHFDGIKIPDNANIDDIVSSILDSDDSQILNHAIVEFATDSIQGDTGVDYELFIKPGQQLTQNTIIGKVTINGVTKEIRSIFDGGTVLANESGDDFLHAFPGSGANRHFIVEDFGYCGEAPDFNTEEIEKIQEKFKLDAYLTQFIGDNICESALPYILTKRYDEWIYKFVGPLRVHDERPNGREIYRKYMDVVDDIRKKYQDDLKQLGSEENIKKCNGNMRKMNNLGQQIIDRRKKYITDIISCYKDYKTTLDLSEYDPEYSDCKYLAYAHDIDYRSRKTRTYVNASEYDNYYVTLLSHIDTTIQNPYAKEYYNILKKIIEKRVALEQYDIKVVAAEFNELFKKAINTNIKDSFDLCVKMMTDNQTEFSVGNVTAWINNHTNPKQVNDNTAYTIKQLANIFMFIKTYDKYELTDAEAKSYFTNPDNTEEGQEHPMFRLIKEENKILEEFWTKVLTQYAQLPSMSELFEECKTVGDKIVQYAEWPAKSYLTLDGYTYEHFLFQNGLPAIPEEPDEDLGTEYETNEPVIPDSMDPPDATQDDLSFNDNDPSDREPTPKDFAYWQRYFALATVISLPYFNCGIDIITPAGIISIPLPCIFICISAIYIKLFDITIVIGISIRGMYIWPIILFVNLSNQYASILTPLIGMLKSIQSKISAKLEGLLEKPVMSIANMYINMLEEDNRRLRRENIQLTNWQTQIKTKKVKNMEKIRKNIERIVNPNVNPNQHIIDPINSEPQ